MPSMQSPIMQTTSTGSAYLPNYLLGEHPSSVPPRAFATPGRKLRISPDRAGPTSGNMSLGKFDYSPFAGGGEKAAYRPSPLLSHASAGRDTSGAPPTEGLYGGHPILAEVSKSDVSLPFAQKGISFGPHHASSETIRTPGMSCSDDLNVSVFSPRPDNRYIQSPAQVDPFYTEGDSITSSDVLDDTAVTIFGFPPAASSYILQQFSQYGSIVQYEIHNTGNWMHVKYQTRIQAKKALSKNCKIFSRNIMIGVCPCIKKEIASIDSEMSFSCATPARVSAPDSASGISTPLGAKPASMRPLAGTPYRPPSSQLDAVTGNKGTPQKKDSVITKAMDYVFGW